METHDILTKDKTDILFLSETKLDSCHPNAQFHVNRFSIHKLYRNSHSGGLLCYVKETFPN